MLLLVSKAHETLRKYGHRHVGRFCGPRNFHRMRESVRAGFVWAADNDAFNGFNEEKYLRMLDGLQGVPACLFVTAPDVVADAEATYAMWEQWRYELEDRGFPVGYVGQDGATVADVPWPEISALFVGGSTEWKLGDDAAKLVYEARERGKWVHMGRVNTWRRIEYAKSIGVDSIDGTQLSWFTDTYLEQWVEFAAAPSQIRIGERLER